MHQPKRVYKILNNFNNKCNSCNLSNGASIAGHTYSSLSEIKLIVVLNYPTLKEVKEGFSLIPNEVNNKLKISNRNAGRYFQETIKFVFDNDLDFPQEYKPFYSKIAFTNIIKCTPFNFKHDKTTITPRHIKTCKQLWLEKEIAEIAKYNPTCPILLCGKEAVKLLGDKQTLYNYRRKVFYYKTLHPVLLTFNPNDVLKYTANFIKESRSTPSGKLFIDKALPEKPIRIGSPAWHWLKDINLIKKIILDNIPKEIN